MTAYDYIPEYGTAAAFVVSYLQSLPDDTEIGTGIIAQAVGIPISAVFSASGAALRSGLIANEKIGHRYWWRAGPRKLGAEFIKANPPKTLPLFNNAVSLLEKQEAKDKLLTGKDAFTKTKPDPYAERNVPIDGTFGVDLGAFSKLNNGDGVVNSGSDSPAVADDVMPVLAMRDGLQAARNEASKTQVTATKSSAIHPAAEFLAPDPAYDLKGADRDAVVKRNRGNDAMPTVSVAQTRQYSQKLRCGIWSDGSLAIERDGRQEVFNPDEVTILVRFLDRMLLRNGSIAP